MLLQQQICAVDEGCYFVLSFRFLLLWKNISLDCLLLFYSHPDLGVSKHKGSQHTMIMIRLIGIPSMICSMQCARYRHKGLYLDSMSSGARAWVFSENGST